MSKSTMIGTHDDYLKMFKAIMNWGSGTSDSRWYQKGTHKTLGNEEGHYIWNLNYTISEMGWFGWEGEKAQNERANANKVTIAYYYLLKALAEAVGFEYPPDEDVWKYDLKYIDTNDLLELYKVYKERKKSKTPVGEDLTEKIDEPKKGSFRNIDGEKTINQHDDTLWTFTVYKNEGDENS